MKTSSASKQTILPCLLLNSGRPPKLVADHLTRREAQRFSPLLEPQGGALIFGEPACQVELSWLPRDTAEPAQFIISRGEALLLVAGLATESRQSALLWSWFALLRGATFRCLGRPPPCRWPRGGWGFSSCPRLSNCPITSWTRSCALPSWWD